MDGIPLRPPAFSLRPVRTVFVVDKVTLGRISLRVLRFSFVSIIPPMAYNRHHLNIILIGRSSGRSLETLKMSLISGSTKGKREQ